MSDRNNLTKDDVLKWLRTTASDYVDDGEFARHLNAAANLIESGAVEPRALQPGHWICQSSECRGQNFPDDVRCIHCGTEKPQAEPEARITEMNIKAKASEPIEAYAQFEGGAVKAFAVSLVQWFRESGGENYVTCDLRDPETGEAYSITMQKAGGRTPAQDLCELRQQLNRNGDGK